MKFSWDDAKSARTLRQRRLSFDLAITMFESAVIEKEDVRRDYGERRIQAIGVAGDLVLQCVYTDRGDVRRIISLRLASRRERDGYRAAYPS